MSQARTNVVEGEVIAGKYRIERVLGAGGMGVVFAAWHMPLNQRVALKFLNSEACSQPDAVARFLREAQALARLTSPHVARVMDVGTREQLVAVFRRYGMPDAMLMDNGSPWGSDREHQDTPLTVWLLRRGIAVSHGRPYHPQTQGKEERFHRTLTVEVLAQRVFADFVRMQARFDEWRDCYNPSGRTKRWRWRCRRAATR